MKAELIKKWLGKLMRLNPASGRGQCRGKATHKPLLLLCLVDMAEAGELTGRTFTRTANLVLRFKEYGPWYHSGGQLGLTCGCRSSICAHRASGRDSRWKWRPHNRRSRALRAKLDAEFFDLLADADFRLKARLLLISRYFEPRERVVLLERRSIGVTSCHSDNWFRIVISLFRNRASQHINIRRQPSQ